MNATGTQGSAMARNSTARVELQSPALCFPAYPVAGLAGASFKPEHLPSILADRERRFFEVHAENYMGAGGPPHRSLEIIRSEYPVSLHGVCMSIGGPDALDKIHLERFRQLIERYEPALVSEHLAWSTHERVHFNDLLPLPYNAATLARVCAHIDEVQEVIRRPILLENPSSYLAFRISSTSETDFIRAIAKHTGCGLLLDVNNVYVSAADQGFSAIDYLSNFPLSRVGEIHLAGHARQSDDEGEPLLIDSHDVLVADDVWQLYEFAISRAGAIPTLIEWDSNLPEWPILKAEVDKAQAILDRANSGHYYAA